MEFINFEIAKIANTDYRKINLFPKDSEGINSNCSFVSSKEYYFNQFEIKETRQVFLYQKGPMQNINYNGYIPGLMEIYNRIIKGEKIGDKDAIYIASLSPVKFYGFINKIYKTNREY